MKHIKLFEQFKSHQEIDEICTKYTIINYTINDDGSIDVDANVSLVGYELIELPLKFRKVKGWFDCSFNELTSLEGVPSSVGGVFYCYNNPLYSFEYFPDFVGGKITLPINLEYIFILFDYNKELIYAFNDYNIIKAPKNKDDKPRLKVSNLNKFLSDNGFKELKDTSELVKYYDLK